MATDPDDEDLDDSTVLGANPVEAESLRKDRAYLIVIAGTQVGEMIQLAQSATIGRAVDAEVRIVDDKMSRRHCRVVVEGGASFIEDLGSTNGTYVNGVRIARQQLQDGDKIQVGETTILKFTYHDSLEETFQKQMYDSALRDGLTKVFNKRYFQDRIRTEFAFAMRHRTPLSLILLDIDHFKKVNDTRGHLAGDKVLVALAEHVQNVVRTEDVLARWGGEEFAILCRETRVADAAVLAERIRTSTAKLRIVPGAGEEPVPITISMGIAMVPDADIAEVDGFLGAADEVLYQAKREGRNRVVTRRAR
jgi:two-component system cell cycle response regulator